MAQFVDNRRGYASFMSSVPFILEFESIVYSGQISPVVIMTGPFVGVVVNSVRGSRKLRNYRSCITVRTEIWSHSFISTQKIKHLVARFNSQLRKQTILKYGLDGEEYREAIGEFSD